ncbi:hypothetical protein Ocin01_05255 [Orchesella cincta]|uniref:Uncharacterized protein n=1 Tax=Orchesella cincta TaxID=48709 RepID=A0A1D2N8W0_ORCCI|nr:hypothetical protein Ocin01_05255 [Orchesella cincta]
MGIGESDQRFYMITAAGIAKIVAVVVGCAPVALAIILHLQYLTFERPESYRHILIEPKQRELWELAFLCVVAGALGGTLLNLLLYTIFKGLSRNIWTKRFDCGYFAISGMAQTVVGFIMVGSALTSTAEEWIAMKYAAGFLGIATGIVYWGAATLTNQD